MLMTQLRWTSAPAGWRRPSSKSRCGIFCSVEGKWWPLVAARFWRADQMWWSCCHGTGLACCRFVGNRCQVGPAADWINQSIYLPVYLSIYLYIYVYRSIYLSVYLSISLSLSTSLSIYLPIYRSTYLSVCRSVGLSVCLSICLFIYFFFLVIYLSIYLFSLRIHPSIHPSILASFHLCLPLSFYRSLSLSVSLSFCSFPRYLPLGHSSQVTRTCETGAHADEYFVSVRTFSAN